MKIDHKADWNYIRIELENVLKIGKKLDETVSYLSNLYNEIQFCHRSAIGKEYTMPPFATQELSSILKVPCLQGYFIKMREWIYRASLVIRTADTTADSHEYETGVSC
jgi:hypothetical protein